MASSAELNEVKLIIKGLIASSKNELTIKDLNRDYGREEGRSIPYEKFGFRRLLDFLQSITDTVRIRDNYRDPSNPIVCVVVSEKSEHVVSLVERQNSSKKKGSSNRKYGFGTSFRNTNRPYVPNFNQPYRQPLFIPPPRFQRQPTQDVAPTQPQLDIAVKRPPSPQINPTLNPTERSSPGPVSSPASDKKLPFVPLKVECQIMTLVRENPGISPQYIEESLTASRICVREVYNGIDEVLKTMSHKLTVKDNKVYLTPNLGDFQAENSNQRLNPRGTKKYVPGGYSESDGRNPEFESDEMYVGGFSSDDDAPFMPAGSMMYDGGGDYLEDDGYICESLISERMKSNLAQLLKKFPKGIWCWDLPEQYEAEFGAPLDCRQIGYVSVSQMMRSVPELFNCVLMDGTDCKVYDAKTPFIQEAAISRDMVAQIKELVKTHPSTGIKGIYEDHFCSKFKEVFHTEFNFKDMGFGTLHSLFEALDGEVIQFLRISNRYRICPLMDKENDDAGSLFPPYKKDDETCIKRFPSDVVGPLDNLQRVTFPQDAEIGSFVEVIVAEISSPNNFWAQLRGLEHHVALGKMMDEMELFYGNSSNDLKYTMPAEAIAVGVSCVATYMDSPHRCRIVKVDIAGSSVRDPCPCITATGSDSCVVGQHTTDDTPEVVFVDFGTISLVERSNLRFLLKRFQALPMQAFRCTLHNLKPTEGRVKYPREVGVRFLQLVKDKGLVAEIAAIDHKATTMSLILIDTTGEDDVFINDTLVEEGLAEYCVDSTDPAFEESKVQSEEVDVPPPPPPTEKKQPCAPHVPLVVKQEVEDMPVVKSEPEEKVLARQPAAILLNSRRKIRTPPGFGTQVPSSPCPPEPQFMQHAVSSSFPYQPATPQNVNLNNSILYRQDLSSGDAYRNDYMYLTRYHGGLAPTAIHNLLLQNVTANVETNTYGYKQQFPVAPFIDPNIVVPTFLASTSAPSECTPRLNEPQTKYLQNLIQNSEYSAFSVYPKVTPNMPPYNGCINPQGLNPHAMPYVPPPLMPLVRLPTQSQYPLFNQPPVIPRQPPPPNFGFVSQGARSTFDQFFNFQATADYQRLGLLKTQVVPTEALVAQAVTNNSVSASQPRAANVGIKSEPLPTSSDVSVTSSEKCYIEKDSSARYNVKAESDDSNPMTDSGPVSGSIDFPGSTTESRRSVSNSLQTDDDLSVASSGLLSESVLDQNGRSNDSDSRKSFNSPFCQSEGMAMEDDLADIIEATHLQDSEEDSSEILVRLINIEDVFLHLINVDGKIHLITDEVLHMKYKKNVALKILKSRNTEVEFQELKKESHANIFSELARSSSRPPSSSKIHVVRLKHVPNMLTELKYKANYILAIQDQLESLPQDFI